MNKKALEVLLEELEEKATELQKEIDNFEVNQDEFINLFDECLNEQGEIIVAGITFYPAEILKKCDPIAYRCGLNDFCDGLDIEEIEEYKNLIEELEKIQEEIKSLESELD